MEISDVRVKLIEDANDRLRAVCSVTFDGEFVVRDVKVVDGTHGLFVAMPSRKLSVHCPQCRHKNHLRARFCNDCGGKLPAGKASTDPNGRVRLHRDIAHPINPSFREMVQARVIQSYQTELDASQKPGYKPVDFEGEPDEATAEPTPAPPREPTREPRSEPTRPPVSDPMGEPIEVSEEMTEYDALIAGLKTGSPPRGDSGRGRPPQPRPPREPAPPPGPRSGGERRSESDSRRRSTGGRPGSAPRQDKGSDRPAQPPQRGPRPVKSEGQGERTGRDAPAPVHYEFADETVERTVATAPPSPAPPRETRRVETPPVAAPPPPPRQTPKNEDDSFGAGIL